MGGAGFGARFGVSCMDCDILELIACDPFVAFEMFVDVDFRTADDGRDGGRSFFCGLADSAPEIQMSFLIPFFPKIKRIE